MKERLSRQWFQERKRWVVLAESNQERHLGYMEISIWEIIQSGTNTRDPGLVMKLEALSTLAVTSSPTTFRERLGK